MSITIPTAEQVSYLRKFNVAAIYLIAVPGTAAVLIGSATHIVASSAKLVRRHEVLFRGGKPLEFVWCGWLDRDAAARVVFGVTRRHGGALLKLSVPAAVAEISGMAQRLGAFGWRIMTRP